MITPNVSGIYSTVWVNAGYSGPIFNLRGGTSNATSNIYSDGSTNYYTSPTLNGQTLAQWMTMNGDTKVYVVKWYDQSGLGRDASQNTTTAQPIFNTTLYCVDSSNNNTAYFNLPNLTIPYKGSYTIAVKHGTILNTTNGGFFGCGSNNSVNWNCFRVYNNTEYLNYWYGNDFYSNAGTFTSGIHTVTLRYNTSTTTTNIYLDQSNTSSGSMNRTGWNCDGSNNTLMKTQSIAGEVLTGQLYFAYFFNAVVSDNLRALIQI